MEALDKINELSVCERCFAPLEKGADYCLDCGAPVSDEPGSEKSDSLVYPELARANLLRMRGDYAEAHAVCLRILRRFPNNASAHMLLGDICAEQGDLEHAREWYEMALDLEPDSQASRKKHESVQERITEHEAATTVQQLGLPTTPTRANLFIGLTAGFIVLVGLGAFLAGEAFRRDPSRPRVVNTPISVPARSTGLNFSSHNSASSLPESTADKAIPSTNKNFTPTYSTLGSAGRSQEESLLLDSAIQRTEWGKYIVDARQDPRDRSVVITLVLEENLRLREVAGEVCLSGLTIFSDAPSVGVRVLKAGSLCYVGQISRTALEKEIGAEDFKGEKAASLLTNEWQAQ